MAGAMKDTTARLLAEQLRSAERRADRYEAALREIVKQAGYHYAANLTVHHMRETALEALKRERQPSQAAA